MQYSVVDNYKYRCNPQTGLKAYYNDLKELVFLKDKEGNEVYHSQIWINGLPGICLKLFKSTILNLEEMEGSGPSDKKHYDLKTKNWIWWNDLIPNKENLKLNILDKDTSERWTSDHIFPSFLTVLGLKIYIGELPKKNPLVKDYTTYRLYHGIFELEDNLTLGECGIMNEETIHVKLLQDPDIPFSPEQGYKITDDESVKTFKTYFPALKEKLGLICLINTDVGESGTGFLIGGDLIMTNEHVLFNRRDDESKKSIKEQKREFPDRNYAKFFFDEGSDKGITIPIQKVVFTRESPGKDKLPTFYQFDCTIAKLNMTFLSWCEQRKMEEIGCLTSSFFPLILNNNEYTRATIIQHPEEKSKHISFRDNALYYPCLKTERHYHSGTNKGSSGSPILSDKGEVIGLHRSSCIKIEKKLREKRAELKKTIQDYIDLEDKKFTIDIHYDEANESIWWEMVENDTANGISRGGSLLALLDTIGKKYPNYINIRPHQWAFHFLAKHMDRKAADELENHISCNTGVPINLIINALDNTTKETIKRSQQVKKPYSILKMIVAGGSCFVGGAVLLFVLIRYFRPSAISQKSLTV